MTGGDVQRPAPRRRPWADDVVGHRAEAAEGQVYAQGQRQLFAGKPRAQAPRPSAAPPRPRPRPRRRRRREPRPKSGRAEVVGPARKGRAEQRLNAKASAGGSVTTRVAKRHGGGGTSGGGQKGRRAPRRAQKESRTRKMPGRKQGRVGKQTDKQGGFGGEEEGGAGWGEGSLLEPAGDDGARDDGERLSTKPKDHTAHLCLPSQPERGVKRCRGSLLWYKTKKGQARGGEGVRSMFLPKQ